MDYTNVDTELLGNLMRSRRERDGLSLRDAADQIGVSAPTLQRVESGQIPTAGNLLRILDWLELQLSDVRPKKNRSKPGRETIAEFEVHLRADPTLDAKAAEAIVSAVQKLYEAYSKQRNLR